MKNKDNPVPSLDELIDLIELFLRKNPERDGSTLKYYIDLQVEQNNIKTNKGQPKCTDRCDCNFFLKNLELCEDCI